MNLQKSSFIKHAGNCPYWLKIALRKELGHLAQKYGIAILKIFFPDILSNTSLDFASDMGVTNHRHYD